LALSSSARATSRLMLPMMKLHSITLTARYTIVKMTSASV
jgi:hypothetical protein